MQSFSLLETLPPTSPAYSTSHRVYILQKGKGGLAYLLFPCASNSLNNSLASISDHRSKTTLYNDRKALNVLSTELLLQLQSRQTQTKAFCASVHC
jgi:hypothetical protein